MSDLLFQPAHELRQQLLNKHISAEELTHASFAQIAQVNDKLNAMVTLDQEGAMLTAKALDLQLAKTGSPQGLLHGLPLAVKDVFNTLGIRTTFGNKNFADHVPTEDDILVSREKQAAAVIIGKSNTPDCASGGITKNNIFGLTHNPWNEHKTTSGSGGGGISALMGGMVSLADGSDIGGSVRSPACWSHCVGYRPTSGLIPGLPGQCADGDTSTAGIFARCVTDAALFMQAVIGPDQRSAIAYPQHQPLDWQQLEHKPSLPVAWDAQFANIEPHAEIARNFADQEHVFQQAGISVAKQQVNLGQDFQRLYSDFNSLKFFAGLPAVVQQQALKGASKASHNAYADFMRNTSALEINELLLKRDQLKVKMQALFSQHSALVTPVHAGLAFGVDDHIGEAATDWSPLYLAPLLGLPSIVVPSGYTNDGMPIGILITGPAGSDQQLLQLARYYEQEINLPIGKPDLSWCYS
jgi:amidase